MAQSSSGALFLAELYPELSPEELRVAEENIDRYLGFVWQIPKRTQRGSNAPSSEIATASENSADLARQQEHGM